MTFTNFPWTMDNVTSNSTSPYLSTHVVISTIIPACVTGYFNDTTEHSGASFSNGKQEVAFWFDKIFLIDGVPFNNNQSLDGSGGTLNRQCDLEPIPYSWSLGLALCVLEGFGVWEEAIYDPTLSSIFLISEEPLSTRKSHYPLIVGMVILGVIILVGIIILLVLFFPPMIKQFMPSRMAKPQKLSNEQSTGSTTVVSGSAQASPNVSPRSDQSTPESALWNVGRPSESAHA